MRYLHTMVRVRDLPAALRFFCEGLGLREIRRRDSEQGRFTLVFLGEHPDGDSPQLELTYNWDQQEPYTHGTGFGHLAVAVSGIYDVCARLAAEGITISRPPGPMKFGGPTIAFIVDPDGYKVELIET